MRYITDITPFGRLQNQESKKHHVLFTSATWIPRVNISLAKPETFPFRPKALPSFSKTYLIHQDLHTQPLSHASQILKKETFPTHRSPEAPHLTISHHHTVHTAHRTTILNRIFITNHQTFIIRASIISIIQGPLPKALSRSISVDKKHATDLGLDCEGTLEL